jgi:hypothetical protein
MPRRQARPGMTRTGTGEATNLNIASSLTHGLDNRHHDALAPLVELVLELVPRLPRSVAVSLLIEKLDESACRVLDREWSEARQSCYPAGLRAAHSRHAATYAERRAVELAAVRGSS